MTITYAGASLSISDEVPTVPNRAGFLDIIFKAGACALQEVPKLDRTWGTQSNNLAGRKTNSEIKDNATWDRPQFNLTKKLSDEAQEIYRALEDDPEGVGSFALTLPNNFGTFYFTAQVARFSPVNGGSKDTIHSGAVELLIQSDLVYINNLKFEFVSASTLTHIIRTSDGQPYSIDYGDGNGPQVFNSSSATQTYTFAGPTSGVATISLSDAIRFEVLVLSGQPWSPNIAELLPFTNLQWLSVHSTGAVGDVSALKNMTNMRTLQLYNTGLTGDVAVFENMPELRTLQFQNVALTGDIASLSNLIQLITLQGQNSNLHGNISDLSGYEGLINFQLFNTGVTGSAAELVNHNISRFYVGCEMTAIDLNLTLARLNSLLVENATINLGFNNEPAASFSQVHIDGLIARGCTVTTN